MATIACINCGEKFEYEAQAMRWQLFSPPLNPTADDEPEDDPEISNRDISALQRLLVSARDNNDAAQKVCRMVPILIKEIHRLRELRQRWTCGPRKVPDVPRDRVVLAKHCDRELPIFVKWEDSGEWVCQMTGDGFAGGFKWWAEVDLPENKGE